MIRHGVMGRVRPAVFFVVFVMVTDKVCVCVSACACASAFCRNKTSLLDCALKTKDLLVWDCRDNWYVCYRKHFVCFLVVFHDLFPSVLFICFFGWDQNTKRFKRMLIYFNTHTQCTFFFYLVPWRKYSAPMYLTSQWQCYVLMSYVFLIVFHGVCFQLPKNKSNADLDSLDGDDKDDSSDVRIVPHSFCLILDWTHFVYNHMTFVSSSWSLLAPVLKVFLMVSVEKGQSNH